MPKISVIMPVYNAEKYIKKSLDCILQQTFNDFEVILIDDCGNDRSMGIISEIRDSRVKIIHNDFNMGIALSRNQALDIANGEYIALMDDDDLTPINRFKMQVAFLDNNKDIDVVGGRYEVIDQQDNCLKVFPEPLNNPNYIKAYMMFYNPIANGTVMMRRDFLEDNKIRYKDDCYGMEDYMFWIECSLHGKITNLPNVLLSWRNTSTNETYRTSRIVSDMRDKKYASLQKYALLSNGFKLDIEDIVFFNKMFREDIKSSSATVRDLNKLYYLLNNIVDQAEKMSLSNKQEINIVCKKMFSLRMENSDIWKK